VQEVTVIATRTFDILAFLICAHINNQVTPTVHNALGRDGKSIELVSITERE
jgi:hypothetical protein